jgi:hypothetical protein
MVILSVLGGGGRGGLFYPSSMHGLSRYDYFVLQGQLKRLTYQETGAALQSLKENPQEL